MNITKKKKKGDKNGCEYILFRFDVYFTEYFLVVEIHERNHEDRDLVIQIFVSKFKKKKKKKN